ncbi:MAG: large-conductance mechanosensitive channel protein MscL [bacterium]
MSMLKDFKSFALKGNMLDLAVGVVIGGAFGKVVSSIVSDLIMPPIGFLIGGINFTDIKWTLRAAIPDSLTGKTKIPAITINVGNFIQTAVDFTLIAFSVFILVKLLSSLHRKEEIAAVPPAPSDETKLLTEIRDLLKNQK